MPIHDLSYRHWDGQLKPHTSLRWWVITKAELRHLAQRKFVRLIVAIPPAIYILVHGVLIYLANRLPGQVNLPWQIDPGFFKAFILRVVPFPSGLFIGLLGVFGGAGLIADDLKYNALQLYLSKPITWFDYLLGKLGVMVILLASITFIPGILLLIEHLLLVEDLTFIRHNYWVAGSILLYSIIIVIPLSLLVIALSSLTSNARYAAISFGAILIGTPLVYELIRQITRSSQMAMISIWANYDILGAKLFGMRPGYACHWLWSLLTLIGLVGLCLWVLHRRVQAVHIVK